MKSANGTMFPALKYTDAKAAIEWLCSVLGFEKKLLVPGSGNSIAHAQLSLGKGMIMLGSQDDGEYGKLVSVPHQINNANTQVAYIYIEEIEAHYKTAKSKGAEMIIPLREEEYGGKYYLCRDPEGYLWSIGSYDPLSD